jgi:hypothetical protein
MSFFELKQKEIAKVAGGLSCCCNADTELDGGMCGGWAYPDAKDAANCERICCAPSDLHFIDGSCWIIIAKL